MVDVLSLLWTKMVKLISLLALHLVRWSWRMDSIAITFILHSFPIKLYDSNYETEMKLNQKMLTVFWSFYHFRSFREKTGFTSTIKSSRLLFHDLNRMRIVDTDTQSNSVSFFLANLMYFANPWSNASASSCQVWNPMIYPNLLTRREWWTNRFEVTPQLEGLSSTTHPEIIFGLIQLGVKYDIIEQINASWIQMTRMTTFLHECICDVSV